MSSLMHIYIHPMIQSHISYWNAFLWLATWLDWWSYFPTIIWNGRIVRKIWKKELKAGTLNLPCLRWGCHQLEFSAGPIWGLPSNHKGNKDKFSILIDFYSDYNCLEHLFFSFFSYLYYYLRRKLYFSKLAFQISSKLFKSISIKYSTKTLNSTKKSHKN